ncbi:MAG: tyrosine-type recombinase/integrase [Rhizobiales bacterium]|nr:tyrosine-type recombinase/integrase [Hyphomicrobiales bacterium]
MRHGFAIAAFEASVPHLIVQRWLGHASLKTTAVYTQVSGAERMWDPTDPSPDDFGA